MNVLHFDVGPTSPDIARGHLQMGGKDPHGNRIEVNSYYLEKNGQPWLPTMGEFQYSRYPADQWETELLKIKAGGIDIVATYAFWIHHEERSGEFNWAGNRDVRQFITLCHKHGLLVALRIGPFCHGEARNGGLPDWIYGQPYEARSNDVRYINVVRRYYSEIGRQVQGLMYRDGGPVISIQLENEYGDSAAPWETTQLQAQALTPVGSGGVEHMRILKQLAMEAGMSVPLFTATGWGQSPILADEILPLFGAYAFWGWIERPEDQKVVPNFIFQDRHAEPHPRFDRNRVPFACCELGSGMQAFYKNRPVVPPESVEATQVVYLGCGTNMIGYYVYHGGSNPTRPGVYFNEHRCPRISYDFQAPIREFGQLTESYHRLRRQFLFLQTWGDALAPLPYVHPTGQAPIDPTDTHSIRCAARASGNTGFIFVNNYQSQVETQPVGPFHVRVNLLDEVIEFPCQNGLTLPRDVCGIFPVHLNLAGVDLRYATAQPLTWVEGADGDIHYFFFTPGDMPAEFSFTSDTISGMALPPGTEVHREGHCTTLTLKPDMAGILTLTSSRGQSIHITVLSHAESLRFWKAPLWGRQRVVISDTDLWFDGDTLILNASDRRHAHIRIFPDPGRSLRGPIDSDSGIFEGIYRRYQLSLPVVRPDCTVEMISPVCAVVHVAPEALATCDEILLDIDYTGDIGTAWVDGALIHDNFSNGQPWMMGLRRFLTPGLAQDIVIRVLPKRAGTEPAFGVTEMAAIQMNGANQVGEIRSIRATGITHVSVK